MRSKIAALSAASLLAGLGAGAAPVETLDMPSLRPGAGIANTEIMLVPPAAREPILLAAHHAYTVWSQQFMGALLEPSQTEAWREFQGMDIRIGDAYRQMGQSAYQEGRLEDAIKMLTVAADYLPEDTELLASLGYALKETGKYERAVEKLKRASELSGADAGIWLWLGDAYRLMGNYEESYRALMTARDVASPEQAEEFNNYVTYTQALMDLAPSWDNFETHRDFVGRHQQTGRVLRQIDEYRAALRVAPTPEAGNKDDLYRIGWVNLQIGTQYAYLKFPALAVDYYLEAMDYYTQAESSGDLMRVHQNLALAYEELAARYPLKRKEHLESAATQWRISMESAKKAGEAEFTRHTQGGLLAALAVIRPLDDQELSGLREALSKEIPRRGPINDYSIASATRGEVACRLAEEDLGGARILIEMADEYYKETGFLVDLEYRAAALTQLAEIYLEQDHAKRAAEVAGQAIEQVNALRQYLDTDGFLRSANPQTLREAASVLARAALRDGSPEQAFEALEQYQAKLGNDLLGARVNDEAWRTDFATEEKLLLEREGWLRAELDSATAARDTERIDWLTERLADNGSRVRRLGLAAGLPPESRISYRPITPLTALEAQAALPANLSVLHLVTGKRGGAAVLMTGSEVKGAELPEAAADKIEELVYKLRLACDAGDEAEATAQAAALRTALLDPLAGMLPVTGGLAFAGDQITLLLPLRLLDPEGEIVPASLGLFNAAGVSFLDRIAGVRRGSVATGVEAVDGATPLEMLGASPASGGARLTVSLDVDSEDPTFALWSPQGSNDITQSSLTASLLKLDLQQSLIALDLELSGGRSHTAQQHFAAIGELAWRSGCGAVILNQWRVAPEVRNTFLSTLNDALLSSSPLDAFQLAKDAVRIAHPKSTDWAAFVYLGAP